MRNLGPSKQWKWQSNDRQNTAALTLRFLRRFVNIDNRDMLDINSGVIKVPENNENDEVTIGLDGPNTATLSLRFLRRFKVMVLIIYTLLSPIDKISIKIL